jgi:outer membrane protein
MLYFCHMRYLNQILLLLLLGTGIQLQAQEKWDLRKCVDYAWSNNISVQQQDVQARLAALTEKQAKQQAYPNANFSTNLGLQFGRSVDPTTNLFTTTQLLFQGVNLNADVTIFNWHRVKNNLLAAKTDTKAALANVEKIKNDIALSVATSFLQALLNKEQVNI